MKDRTVAFPSALRCPTAPSYSRMVDEDSWNAALELRRMHAKECPNCRVPFWKRLKRLLKKRIK